MTEQEAKALATRLNRIWEPESNQSHVSQYGKFTFNGRWASGLLVHIEQEEDSELLIELVQKNTLLLTAYCDEIEEGESPQHERLLMEWRPRFRRNSWLSGSDIEATAQEKSEWIQGLTSQEIEAWNLEV